MANEPYDEDDIRYCAMHEAGHAVAAILNGLELKSVDLKPCKSPDGRESRGFTNVPIDLGRLVGKGEAAAMPCMVYAFAGPMAESKINYRLLEFKKTYIGDNENINKFAAVAVCDLAVKDGQEIVTPEECENKRDRINELITAASEAANRLVEDHLGKIEEVANALIEKRALTGDEVAAIVNAPA